MTAVQVPPLGTLKRIDAREVWKHEALQFTPWLREHIGALADALQLDLEPAETEVPASATSLAYQRFYEEFIQRYKQAYPHASCASRAYPQNWLTVSSAGRSGFSYGLTFPKGGGWRVELYTDTGDQGVNKAAFDV